jgi:NADPH2:quinone reductase
MRCIEVAAPGGPEVLQLVSRPVPQPGEGEILVGMEVSGQIAELGEGTTARWRVGDAVCALLSGGGYAEYCAVPEGQCMPVPGGISVHAAAAIPEAAITVWANLFEPRRLFAGNLFLVQGGSSGIGTMAVQIARAFGARVATTAGTDEKCRFCLSLGAEIAVNYRANEATGGWAAELARWAAPHGIDAILDMIGGDYFAKHIDLLAPGGRLMQIAFTHGSQVTVDLRTMMTKRLLVTGSTLRPRTVAEKSDLARAVEHKIWPLFATGQIKPVIDAFFPLARATDAHRLMESGRHTGKIVLDVE